MKVFSLINSKYNRNMLSVHALIKEECFAPFSSLWQGLFTFTIIWLGDSKGKNNIYGRVERWYNKSSHHIASKNLPKLYGNCAFSQNFHSRKLGEITIFFAVPLLIFHEKKLENSGLMSNNTFRLSWRQLRHFIERKWEIHRRLTSKNFSN